MQSGNYPVILPLSCLWLPNIQGKHFGMIDLLFVLCFYFLQPSTKTSLVCLAGWNPLLHGMGCCRSLGSQGQLASSGAGNQPSAGDARTLSWNAGGEYWLSLLTTEPGRHWRGWIKPSLPITYRGDLMEFPTPSQAQPPPLGASGKWTNKQMLPLSLSNSVKKCLTVVILTFENTSDQHVTTTFPREHPLFLDNKDTQSTPKNKTNSELLK